MNNKFAEIECFIRDYLMPYAKDIEEHFEKYNAKDLLQQYTQGIDKTLPIYRTVGILGPAHKPIFEVEVSLGVGKSVTAKGRSKKMAEMAAADAMLEKIN
jgi:ribonuclease-3